METSIPVLDSGSSFSKDIYGERGGWVSFSLLPLPLLLLFFTREETHLFPSLRIYGKTDN